MKSKNKYEEVLTKDILLLEYVKKQQSVKIIAKNFGVTPHTIYKYLKLHGIEQEDRRGLLKTGDIFGKLKLIETIGKSKNNTFYWKCICECGNTTKVTTSDLKIGKVKSCGCLKKANGSNSNKWKGYEEISGNFFSSVRSCAKNRKIDFCITIQQIWNKYIHQNKKCYLSGLDINFNFNKETSSIDRIDSNKHYFFENIAICHKDINKIKSDYSITEFLQYCQKVYSFDGKFNQIDEKPIICNSYFCDIISNANRRKKEFLINIDYLQQIYCKQGGVCAISGIPIVFATNSNDYRQRLQTASIDRIDNSQGYIFGNIQLVHKKINKSRNNFTIERYKELCRLVATLNQYGPHYTNTHTWGLC